MNRLFKPAAILLYLLTVPTFFILGAIITRISGAADGQGLAGGAIVFMYGIFTASIALIISFFIAFNMSHKTIVKVNQVLAVVLLLFVIFIVIRINNDRKDDSSSFYYNEGNTEVVFSKMSSTAIEYIPGKIGHTKYSDAISDPIGLGFFAPDFFNYRSLNFYNNGNIPSVSFDSVVFAKSDYGDFEITSAPPWLVPDHLKLDYSILLFRIISVTKDYVEVVVNKTNGQTSWVSRDSGTISYWPDFLLHVFSVESKDATLNPLLIKPMGHASKVTKTYEILSPLQISGEWIKVTLRDDNFKETGEGWIRWKKDNQILITYSLLS